MDVKQKYKQTDAGMIPEEWSFEQLGALATFHKGRGLPKSELDSFGAEPCIHYGELFTQYPETIRDIISRTNKSKDNFRSVANDVLMPTSDVTPTGLAKASCITENGIILGGDILVIRTNKNQVHGPFLSYVIRHSREQILQLVTGTTVYHLYAADMKKFRLLLPPIEEQEAISESLSDADTYIKSLEQLIAKKRQIKQGAMQKLFTANDHDEIRPLGEISTLKGRIGWQGLKQSEFTSNEDEPFLITGMNFKDGAIRWNEVYHVSEDRYDMAKEIQLRKDDVLMTKDGTIGKVLFIDEIPYPGKASLNSHLLLFRPIREGYYPKYLYYQLSSRRFTDFIELSKSGSTFFGLSQAAVEKYPVLLPNREVQIATATTLSDMDDEVATLERKLTKAQQIKQGMMQELLTGRIRLI